MKQELLLLLKQKSIQYLLGFSFLLTCVSLFNGWQNISHMQAQIHHAQLEEQRQHASQLKDFNHQGKIDAGEVGYYVYHYVYHHPNAWSFVALGNRLVTPYVQRIRLLGLQGQIYDGESHHPEYVMLGAFDYAFWLVFFLPLLCIALMHDLRASEFQEQRLTFLQSTFANPANFWIKRVLIRWLLVLLTFTLPLFALTVLKSLPIQGLIDATVVTTLYSIFWILLCCIISLRKEAINASNNAIVLASIWLVICVVLPNLSQLWLHHRYTVQDGSQIALQHRQLVHNAWDLPKNATLDSFYKIYPEWQNTPPVTGRFHWKWYYAFQHMADVNLTHQVEQREKSLRLRDHATANLSYVLPSLWVQRKLESMAKSNVTHLLEHRRKIEAYHGQLRNYFYPYLFNEEPLNQQMYKAIPDFQQY